MKKIVCMVAVCLGTVGAYAQVQTDSLRLFKLQEVVVKGVRAQKNAPFAVANIKKAELSSFSKTGRELPFLFANTPGVLAWSEIGTGIGTSHIRIRGAADSRINVTLDGVALNSPEDECVFWANMNSYASLMGSAQIQRGVGTSTNGDGAFGGTISLATAAPSLTPSLEVNGGYGTYNSYNVGMNFSSGLLWNRLVFNGAYHESRTDGFMHGTAGRSGSYLGALTYYGDKFTLSYKNIGNFEKTGQAWSGATGGNDDATLVADGIYTYKDMYKHGLGRYNYLYEGLVFDDDAYTFPKDANGNYQTYRYKMNNGSLWDRTTDNFYQSHNILSAVFTPSAHWSHHVALHYTYGYGYYAELKPTCKFNKFGLTYYDRDGNFTLNDAPATAEQLKSVHKLIKKVSQDIPNFSYNTSISAFMICINELQQLKCTNRGLMRDIVVLIAPFAPHIAEELWEATGGTGSVCDAAWPAYNDEYLVESTIQLGVAFNGKRRFEMKFAADADNKTIEEAVLADERSAKYTEGKQIVKVIIVPKRMVNIVIK